MEFETIIPVFLLRHHVFTLAFDYLRANTVQSLQKWPRQNRRFLKVHASTLSETQSLRRRSPAYMSLFPDWVRGHSQIDFRLEKCQLMLVYHGQLTFLGKIDFSKIF